MHKDWIRVVWGLLLIIAGVLMLLVTLGYLAELSSLFWGLVLAGLGVTFMVTYFGDRSQWWPLIPAGAFLPLGLGLLLTWIGLPDWLLPEFLFLGLCAAFATIYLFNRQENWWALIPGGVMLILAIITPLERVLGGVWVGAFVMWAIAAAFGWLFLQNRRQNWWALIPGGVMVVIGVLPLLAAAGWESLLPGALFIGIGLVFVVLYLLRSPEVPTHWALWVAGPMFLFGLALIMFLGEGLLRYFWPALLILLGAGMLVRNLLAYGRVSREVGRPTEPPPPPAPEVPVPPVPEAPPAPEQPPVAPEPSEPPATRGSDHVGEEA
ncbi:MAG: hypothetical protein H5T64_03845 [Chloroflexi bacterium]|nr:hypothetical protein [Chloroflexota bacterium]